ncbi:hypothetical protein SAMN04515624_13626 [Eubacterium maltosivorans]|uniref:hypothetical protein n=1 Tax=Eubacterium maltosivorans TaxID=2041044 RepID=UPI00087F31D5|nr:hypothetical protein [Eubacterium maltosivorans]WPK81879.1 hypothetical protein EUMA32_33370 [Eubacterium maltosivorans]SDP83140.1 hypothetical protein SAMN04515624_13626 [Eubacterium maltosivorans]
MNYKIIYFEGEGFTSLADFKKAYILDIDRIPTIIAYDKGQRLELRNIRSVTTEELKDFGTLVKITTDRQSVYAAAVIVSFKGGLAVAHNVKTANLKVQLEKLAGLDDSVERYGYYEVTKEEKK